MSNEALYLISETYCNTNQYAMVVKTFYTKILLFLRYYKIIGLFKATRTKNGVQILRFDEIFNAFTAVVVISITIYLTMYMKITQQNIVETVLDTLSRIGSVLFIFVCYFFFYWNRNALVRTINLISSNNEYFV